LAAFENVYNEALKDSSHPRTEPSWATKLHQFLSERARALVPAESYQNAVKEVQRLGGHLLPFEDAAGRGGRRQPPGDDGLGQIVQQGLQKPYRQGRELMRQVITNAEASDEEWVRITQAG